MLLEIQLCLVFINLYFVHGKDLDIIVKFDPKQIVDTLQSEFSLKYLREFLEVFAKKAAETFIKEIKNNEHLITEETKLKNENKFNRVHQPVRVNKYILNEEKAHKLLEKPSPDGDDRGWHSPELSDDEEYKEKNKGIPVFGLTKVNGIYVRRFYLELFIPSIKNVKKNVKML